MAGEAVLLCGRTVCTNPAHPAGWNRITGEMYCIECAGLLNRVAHHTPGGALCPLLVAHDPVRDVPTGSTGYMVLIDETNLRKPTR